MKRLINLAIILTLLPCPPAHQPLETQENPMHLVLQQEALQEPGATEGGHSLSRYASVLFPKLVIFGLFTPGRSSARGDDVVLCHLRLEDIDEFISFRKRNYLQRKRTRIEDPHELTRDEMIRGYELSIRPGDQTFILARQAGRIIGYAQASIDRSQSLGYLPELAVESSVEGRGLATALMNEAIDWLWENHRRKMREVQFEDDSPDGQSGKIGKRFRFLYFLGPKGEHMFRLPVHGRRPAPATRDNGEAFPWQTFADIERMDIEPAWGQNIKLGSLPKLFEIMKNEFLKFKKPGSDYVIGPDANRIERVFTHFLRRAIINGSRAERYYRANFTLFEDLFTNTRPPSGAALLDSLRKAHALVARNENAASTIKEYPWLAGYAAQRLAEIRCFNYVHEYEYPWDPSNAFFNLQLFFAFQHSETYFPWAANLAREFSISENILQTGAATFWSEWNQGHYEEANTLFGRLRLAYPYYFEILHRQVQVMAEHGNIKAQQILDQNKHPINRIIHPPALEGRLQLLDLDSILQQSASAPAPTMDVGAMSMSELEAWLAQATQKINEMARSTAKDSNVIIDGVGSFLDQVEAFLTAPVARPISVDIFERPLATLTVLMAPFTDSENTRIHSLIDRIQTVEVAWHQKREGTGPRILGSIGA